MTLSRSEYFILVLKYYVKLTGKNIGFSDTDTDIVIEGFPRCGNTYAYCAFLIAQNEAKLNIAHHVHGSAQVSKSVKLKIPALVLIRQPKEAVLSLVVRDPSVSVLIALKQYINFYKDLSEFNHYIVADFQDVISDFGLIVDKLNSKFGTDFKRYEKNIESEAKVMKLVEELDKLDQGGERVNHLKIAIPSESKETKKKEIEAEFNSPDVVNLLKQADELYLQFLSR